jgi:hypothetical protein
MKTLKLIGKIILSLSLTVIFWFTAIYILGEIFKLNNNVSGGVAHLSVLYFWGIYFLNKENFLKILGGIFFTIGVLINLILIASPYEIQIEYATTRIFVIPALAAGIYLVFRHSIASKVFGILLLITTIFCFLLGLFFMIGNLPGFD